MHQAQGTIGAGTAPDRHRQAKGQASAAYDTPLARLIAERGSTYYAVCHALQAEGHSISLAQVGRHMRGERGISLRHALAYAGYFGVDPAYFAEV